MSTLGAILMVLVRRVFAYLRGMVRLAGSLLWYEKVAAMVLFSVSVGVGRWASVAVLHMPVHIR